MEIQLKQRFETSSGGNDMKYSLKRKCVAALGMGLLLSSPARAENLLESILHLMSHPEQARVAAPPAHGMTLTVHRRAASKGHARPNSNVAHKAGKPPALAENEKYLSSASFSQKFRASTETAQKETQEALSYLIEHDKTLRRGDVLVTQNGPVVFDPDRGHDGAFIAANNRQVTKSVQQRLAGYVQPGVQYGSSLVALSAQSGGYAGIDGATAKPDAPADPKIQTADGRTIRFVGGYVSPERVFLSSVRD
jgi:hypothetical protein